MGFDYRNPSWLNVTAGVATCATGYSLYRWWKLQIIAPRAPLDTFILQTQDECKLGCGPLTAVKVKASAGTSARKHPIVFIHGMSHGSWCYRGLQEVLAKRGHTSYALDLRPSKFRTLKEHVQDVHEALSTLKLERPVLAGHSQGGVIAQHYYHTCDAQMPKAHQVAAMGLLATAALGQKKIWQTMFNSVFKSLSWAGLFNPIGFIEFLRISSYPSIDFMQALFTLPDTATVHMTGKEIAMEDYWQLVHSCPLDGEPTYGLVGGGHLQAWAGKEDQVPKFRVPSLVAHMEFDKCYPWPHAEWLVAHYGSELLEVPGQAHCFVDPGAEENFFKPFANWLEKLA